jgi:hypothetical protein
MRCNVCIAIKKQKHKHKVFRGQAKKIALVEAFLQTDLDNEFF